MKNVKSLPQLQSDYCTVTKILDDLYLQQEQLEERIDSTVYQQKILMLGI